MSDFNTVLEKSKRATIHLLICCNVLSLITESIKCIWSLYVIEEFNISVDRIGWIFFIFYILNIGGQIIINLLYHRNKDFNKNLTSFPLIILFLSSILIFFQCTTIKDYRVKSFLQVFILFICFGLISYGSLYNIYLIFSNIILPFKISYKFNKNILNITHIICTFIGPSISGLILYLNNSDYYSIFYILSILTLLISIYSFILCGKHDKLQSIQMGVIYNNDDEYTKLNKNNINRNENEFPVNIENDNYHNNNNNNNNDDDDLSIIDIFGYIPLITFCVISFTVIQILLNWYLYFMKTSNNIKEWISASQLTISSIFCIFGILIVNKLSIKYKYLINKDQSVYYIVNIIFPFMFAIITYLIFFIDNKNDNDDNIFWYIWIIFGLLFGLFYEYNYIILLDVISDINKYFVIQFISNIGAAIGNLICGLIIINDNFWNILSFCFIFECLIGIICCIIINLSLWMKGRKGKGASMMGDGLSDFSSGLSPELESQLSPKRSSQIDKWKDDDIVGDLNISKINKKYKQHGTSVTSVSNSLGILDVDFVPSVFDKQSSDTTD